jgi:hypothetical protein
VSEDDARDPSPPAGELRIAAPTPAESYAHAGAIVLILARIARDEKKAA